MRTARTFIIWTSSTIAIIALLVYVSFVFMKFVQGPALSFSYPMAGTSTTTPFLTIMGNVARVSGISLNGRAIYADQTGKFEEKLLLHPGYNIIEAEASDRFNRSVSQKLEIVYSPENSPQTNTATTSNTLIR